MLVKTALWVALAIAGDGSRDYGGKARFVRPQSFFDGGPRRLFHRNQVFRVAPLHRQCNGLDFENFSDFDSLQQALPAGRQEKQVDLGLTTASGLTMQHKSARVPGCTSITPMLERPCRASLNRPFDWRMRVTRSLSRQLVAGLQHHAPAYEAARAASPSPCR